MYHVVYCDFLLCTKQKHVHCLRQRASVFIYNMCVLYDEFCLAKCQNPVNEPSARQSRQMESILARPDGLRFKHMIPLIFKRQT